MDRRRRPPDAASGPTPQEADALARAGTKADTPEAVWLDPLPEPDEPEDPEGSIDGAGDA